METYIALLRGINVSGKKVIKMALLKSVLEKNIVNECYPSAVGVADSLELFHKIVSRQSNFPKFYRSADKIVFGTKGFLNK